jgi:hypothetical protein
VAGTFVITAGVTPPVTVSATQVSQRKGILSQVVLAFSGALDAGSAQNSADFRLAAVKKIRKRGHTVTVLKPVRIGRLTYNANAQTVTLVPAGRVRLNQTYQLAITGVSDAEGRPLDGNRDGKPGGNFVALLSRSGVTASRPSFRAAAPLLRTKTVAFGPTRRAVELFFRRESHSHNQRLYSDLMEPRG